MSGYIVYHQRNGKEKRQRFDHSNINHLWAKAFYDECGPHSIAMGPRGAGYEYRADVAPEDVDSRPDDWDHVANPALGRTHPYGTRSI